ncbi:DUF4395 domain-containing protein [Saccharicrinis fermentans]|uniref:DUF4395 domain-containing protein n=1 Tax=Saccharicrinis fermentans DSM 9555 = JCM 21142 TaxID=869213 RepID=W7YA67_9BACT|nr:DUF4395 domain-containing protein [Saccharicrinis fermentans]GAF05217.1 hypothetical protein JCM21142_93944 [Saccharicrinis fermentans DSM 9555 = JCM 21142]
MSIFSFGEYIEGRSFKVLNERVVRGNSGIMLLLGFFAFVNAFVIKNYTVLPYISGFLLFNFLVAILINPKFAPTVFISWLLVRKQSPLYIGAVQKRFAWSLGSALSGAIFILSFYLLHDVQYFQPICIMCLICLALMFLETAFGICIGCKLYYLTLKTGLLKTPEEKPNCIGDSCSIGE